MRTKQVETRAREADVCDGAAHAILVPGRCRVGGDADAARRAAHRVAVLIRLAEQPLLRREAAVGQAVAR